MTQSGTDQTLKPQAAPGFGGSRGGGDQLISVLDVIHIVRQHWLIGGFCSVIVAVSVGSLLLMMPPQYRAQSSLVIELDTENIIDVQEVVSSGVRNHNMLVSYMNTHIERLRSRSMAETVIAALDPEMGARFLEGYVGPLEMFDSSKKLPDAAGLLAKKAIEVTWGTQSQAIQIIITHNDPAVAQAVANLYVNQYIQYKAKLRSKATSEAVTFLGQEVEELREKLAIREMALQEYRKEKNLVTAKGGESIISQNLTQWSEAVTNARVRLSGVDSRLEQIRLAGNELTALMNIPFVGGRDYVKEIYAQLQELRRESQVLSETYLSRHPKVVGNQASQTAVTGALSQAIEHARQEVAVEHDTIVGELKDLETRLNETKVEALQMELDLIDYRVLERKVERLRLTYETLSARYSETTIAERMNLNTIRTLDFAVLPTSPVWPDHKKIALVSFCLAGMCFVAVPLGLELLDFRVKTFADIETYVGKQLIGHLFNFPGKSKEALVKAVLENDEDLQEPFRAIYSGLRLKLKFGRKAVSLVLTSSMPSEGKSFVASNIAATFSMHKYKVLLVDCDLRRPTLYRNFGKSNEAGVIKWMLHSQSMPVAQSLVHSPELGISAISNNLDLLCAGGATNCPTEVLGDSRFYDLVAALKEAYDVIIFDTPPVGLFPDATIVADHAMATLFVTRQNQITRQKLRYAVNMMDRTDAPVVGVVFNGLKDTRSVVGFGRYGGSYYGYGYEKDATQYKKYYNQDK
jgi:capsular exopolysaccharide synthesis family protein